jgi:hypothetical protein
MAVRVVSKPDRRYFQDRDGAFRSIENLSITAATPAYPAVLHQTRRTMILADDRSHAVVPLDKDLVVSRNAEMSAVLITYREPTEATWTALGQHMQAEDSVAEIAREAKSKASIDRKKKAAEVR